MGKAPKSRRFEGFFALIVRFQAKKCAAIKYDYNTGSQWRPKINILQIAGLNF